MNGAYPLITTLGDAYRKLRSLVKDGIREPKILVVSPDEIGVILHDARDLYDWPAHGTTKEMDLSLISHTVEDSDNPFWTGTMGETDRIWDVRRDIQPYHKCPPPPPPEELPPETRWRIQQAVYSMRYNTDESFWQVMDELGMTVVPKQEETMARPFVPELSALDLPNGG